MCVWTNAWVRPVVADEPAYPIGVATGPAGLFCVDLDLPGVWRVDGERTLFARGSNLLRKPMNRPRCIVTLGDSVLVGDSATREVYRIDAADAAPVALTGGGIGIPMVLTIDPAGEMLYVGDAEKRATFKLPVAGGRPELVARVNARGLAFDDSGRLWAVTPDDAALVRIDVATGETTPVLTGRPFQYPNGLAWHGGAAYVTDGYGRCIWKVDADGEFEKWHDGDPLVGPVGVAVGDGSLWVADPKQKNVYQFNLDTKDVTPRLTGP